jgi:hypothetical protein
MDDRGQLKAIETLYKGYRFRSRLEARWAVFLDHAGLKWEYEIEGYNLNGLWYLPDFWLPELGGNEEGAWFEVKGPEMQEGDDGWTKAAALATASEVPVFVFSGQIKPWMSGKRFKLDTYTDDGVDRLVVDDVEWLECPICHAVEPARDALDMSCCCVLIWSTRGVTEKAAEAAIQARFGRHGRS